MSLNIIQTAQTNGAPHIIEEDEAITYCVNELHNQHKEEAFTALYCKYYDNLRKYADHRFPELSETDRDNIVNDTFDKIRAYASKARLRTKNGSLSPLLLLRFHWVGLQLVRREIRRRALLAEEFRRNWTRDEAEAFRGDDISERDIEELVAALRTAIEPHQYPKTSHVLAAIANELINYGGLQVSGWESTPTVSALQRHLERKGIFYSTEEICHCLEILRRRARSVLEDNGWQIGRPLSRYRR